MTVVIEMGSMNNNNDNYENDYDDDDDDIIITRHCSRQKHSQWV